MADANGARIIRAPSYLANALKEDTGIRAEASGSAPPVKHANEITFIAVFRESVQGQVIDEPFLNASANRGQNRQAGADVLIRVLCQK